MKVFVLLVLHHSCDPYVEIWDSYQQAEWQLYQSCLDHLDKKEYPEFEDMYISDVINIVSEERGFEYHIVETKMQEYDIYRKGFADGKEHMREQMENLMKYTIHD